MADNKTTYTGVIDVETKGTDSLAKLNKSLNETIDGFEDIGATIEKTRKALQKAKLDGDKVEFKRLRKELNQLETTFEDTEIQSRRFTDALSQQPGIVGLVGGSLKGLDGGMKVLAANPIIAVVTLLAGLFMLLKESLTKTTEGQELLNKMSEGFGKIIGPVMAIVEAVAIPVFEVLVEVISFVADGFARFAKYLGISSEKIEEASRNSSEVLKTAHEEEIKRQEENTKKQEEETAKRIQKQKEEAEKRAQIQKDAMKILDDAMLSSMDNRDRDLLERERLYQEELKTLKLAGITDLTQFEEEYQRDVAEIQERYRLEAEAKQKEIDDKKKADKELQKQKDAEDAQKLKEASIMNNEDEINLLLSKFALENETRQKSYDEELALFQQTRELDRENLVLSGANAKQLQAFDAETAAVSMQLEKMKTEANLAQASMAFGTLAGLIGENSKAGKALSIGQAIIDTYAGATKALAQGGIFGAIAAAGVIAAGLANVKKITSTKLPNLPGGKGSSGGGGTPSIPSITTPSIQTVEGGGLNPTTAISETIAQSQQRPIETYVVSSKVSSTQAMDRRTNSAATFG
jgi:hypothetical protein